MWKYIFFVAPFSAYQCQEISHVIKNCKPKFKLFNYICYHNSLNFSGIRGNSAVLKFLVLKTNSNNMFIWKIVHISEKWCKYILKKHTMYLRLSTLNDQHQTYSLKKKKKYWTLKKKSFGLLGKKSTRLTKKKNILDIASNALWQTKQRNIFQILKER